MLEEKIEALTLALDKNTAQIGELLAATGTNTKTLETLIAGREEALEQLTSKDAEPKKPAKKKPAAKKAEPEPETKAEEKPAAEPEAWNPDLSPEAMRDAFTPYLTGTSDEAEKKTRVSNVTAILNELGAESINPKEGKKHLESEDDKRKALFYVSRFTAGLPVDFNADYDFNADPLTQESASGGSDDDLVG